MKKILIVTYGETTSDTLYNQLFGLIGKYVEIDKCTVSNFKDMDYYDLIIASSKLTYQQLIKRFKIRCDFLITDRVINHKNLGEIIKIEEGRDVLFVNDSKLSAYEAIEQLKELGINHINFIPYYPGCDYDEYRCLDIAITPGEGELVPSYIKEVVEIGSRIISIRSIHEIVNTLNLELSFKEELTVKYIKDIVSITKSIEKSRQLLKESEMSLKMIINNVDLGLLSAKENGDILWVNSKFENMIGKKAKYLIGKNVLSLLRIKKNIEFLREPSLIDIEGIKYLVSNSHMEERDIKRFLLMFEDIRMVKNKDLKLNLLDKEELNKYLYDFSDYMTIDEKNLKMLEKAKMFAKTESNILIQGENGTGKEILAQAIHRNSFRKGKPFIPINITAISENLLESELFGYEPGSFTGADKNGKIGIFEKAKGGTVFIDEIGDAPKYIQTILLRVIQEKRIRRIGSAHEIPIDVRILAATNKNLVKSMSTGEFREDLFFRLNVLPITTIPLRKRKEDIIFVLKKFLDSILEEDCLESVLSLEVIDLLVAHPWKGNVRELQNLSEYILVIYCGKKIQIEDLPEYIQNSVVRKKIIDYNQFLIIKALNTEGYVGRRLISEITGITEGKIRGIMDKCKEEGYIEIVKNKGACITLKGKDILSAYINMETWN